MRRKDRQFGEVSEKTRKNMQKIRSKDTSIEVALRKRLWHDGYRYRKNYKKLPGSPDIAIMKHKIAVFCDSEFFHGKEWDRLKTRLERGKNPQYWIKHIEENMERDRRVEKELEALDWTVIRFWGNDIKKDLEGCLQVIEEAAFDKMLTVEDVSHVLGIGLAHAYEVAHRRDFPTITLGSRIIIPRDKFMEWIDEQAAKKSEIL